MTVFFRDNKSESEMLQPIESRKFSDEERDALMAAIAGSGEWAKDSSYSFMSDLWVNKKDQSIAYVKDEIMGPSLLVVCTHEFAMRLENERKAKTRPRRAVFNQTPDSNEMPPYRFFCSRLIHTGFEQRSNKDAKEKNLQIFASPRLRC